MDRSTGRELMLDFEPPRKAAPDLQAQIEQLITQRGALRHITERSLQAELDQIDGPDGTAHTQADDDDSESDDESSQARQEKLWKVREEMIQKLA